jgi:hypothetical protein
MSRYYCGVPASPVVIVGHVAHARLLLVSTSVTDTLTSRTTAIIVHVTHARLPLASTTAMGTLTSAEHCYCWTRGTRAIAASVHYSDVHYDISRLLLLLDT